MVGVYIYNTHIHTPTPAAFRDDIRVENDERETAIVYGVFLWLYGVRERDSSRENIHYDVCPIYVRVLHEPTADDRWWRVARSLHRWSG